MKLSAVLIVKNEKDHIENVLSSLVGVDEIIVCDTGSTDSTIDLAKKFTDKVFTDYVWNDDFAEARNHALSKATGDWVLSIDADETLEAAGIDKIKALVEKTDKEQFSVRMTHGKNIHNLPRLFKNNGKYSWKGRGHEVILPREANVSDIRIDYGYSTAHKLDPDRMLRILTKSVEENPNSPRDTYYLAREYYYRKNYEKAIELFERYTTIAVWNPELADAYLHLALCYFSIGKGSVARERCLEAIKINPDFKEALVLMSNLHYEPWKSKWAKIAENATNQDVLFVRNVSSAKSDGKPLDMSEMDILYFKNMLAAHTNIDVLEWGSGNSTKYFTDFLRKEGISYTWDAVEHNKGWADVVSSWKIPNVKVIVAEQNTDAYFNQTGKYDLIFIDGRNRRKCLIKAKELLKEGGIVLLHDADREYYHSGFEGYHGKFVNPKFDMPRLWVGSLEKRESKIPKTIHQIWIGDKEMPSMWMNTWKFPDFDYKLWTEKEIDAFDLKNRAIYDKYYAEGCYNGCANIVRTEVLAKYGGVYLDADSQAVGTLEDASFMDWDIFGVYEADNFFIDGKRLIANGVIGCIPNHPIILDYLEAQGKIDDINPSWRKSGPLLWTSVMTQDYSVLPPYTFIPEHHSGQKNRVSGQVYGLHFWGTSKGLYK